MPHRDGRKGNFKKIIINKRFQRKIEDFQCENCGTEIQGDGYTNHCPVCLWSKHVDINPGDRASECKGMMEPIKVEKTSKKTIITHKCLDCQYEKKNKASKNDDFEEILNLIN